MIAVGAAVLTAWSLMSQLLAVPLVSGLGLFAAWRARRHGATRWLALLAGALCGLVLVVSVVVIGYVLVTFPLHTSVNGVSFVRNGS